MFARTLRRWVIALPAMAFLTACDVPNVPDVAGNGNSPTLRGQVTGVTGSDVRVGLLGAKSAGRPLEELVSSAVTDGSYTLRLPPSPRLDLMSGSNANESIGFTLRAYRDVNGNTRYDAGDVLTDAVAESGTFRFFVDDGAPGTYVAGWNLFQNGRYVQTFDTAFNLSES